MLSARLAKTFSLLTRRATTKNTYACNSREHVAKTIESKSKLTRRRTRSFQVTILTSSRIYPRQKLLSSQKLAEASRCFVIAVSEHQESARWQLGLKWRITIRETKSLPRKTSFIDKFSHKIRLKDFWLEPKVTKTLSRCRRFSGDTHLRQLSRWWDLE